MEEKIKLIDEIVKRHPSYGIDKGWAWYIGGMRDTGDWEYRKMLDATLEDLQAFLDDIIRQEAIPPQVLTPEEEADSRIIIQYPDGSWTTQLTVKRMEEFINKREEKFFKKE